MMTYAANFWPLFWTILGAGAVLTALVSLLIAMFPAGTPHEHRIFIVHSGGPAEPREQADQPKAA